jgi:AcrR family transcriptional regulator
VGLDKDMVLDAALTIADRDGFANLSLARVARRLGVRSQSLYAHVDGLEGLRADLQELYQRYAHERFGSAVAGRQGRDALLALGRAYLELAEEHPGLFTASGRPGAITEARRIVEDPSEPLVVVLRGFGLTGKELGHWLRIVWTALFGFATLRVEGMMRLPLDPDASLERMIDAFAAEIEARVGTRPDAGDGRRRTSRPRG